MTGVGEEGEGAGGGRRREQRLGVISAAVFTRRSTAAGVQVQLQVRAGGSDTSGNALVFLRSRLTRGQVGRTAGRRFVCLGLRAAASAVAVF